MCPSLVANYLGCGCKLNCICPNSVCGVRKEPYHGIIRRFIYYRFGNDVRRMLYSDYLKRNSYFYKQLNLFENEKD